MKTHGVAAYRPLAALAPALLHLLLAPTPASGDDMAPALIARLPAGAGSLAFSPDGKSLVTAGRGMSVWRTEGWRKQTTLAEGQVVWAVVYSPGGDLLAALLDNRDGPTAPRIVVWETASWRLVSQTHVTVLGGSYGVCFAPDGSRLAVTTWQREKPTPRSPGARVTTVIDARSGKVLRVLGSPERMAVPVRFGRTRDDLLTCGYDGVTAWNLTSGEIKSEWRGPRPPQPLVAYPVPRSGILLVTWSGGRCLLLDWASARAVARPPLAGEVLGVSPDGRLCATVKGQVLRRGPGGVKTARGYNRITLEEVSAGRVVASWTAGMRQVHALAIAPGRHTVAVGGTGRTEIWRIGAPPPAPSGRGRLAPQARGGGRRGKPVREGEEGKDEG